MNEELNSSKVSKYEHLAPGVQPIIACIGSFGDYGLKKLNLAEYLKNEPFLYNIDTSDFKLSDIQNIDFRSSEDSSYVMSEINDSNKFSGGFFRCVGLVVTGVDKKTGKNISFLSHQDPIKFLSNKKMKFTSDLKQKLAEIKERCKPNSIDAVLVGGEYFTDNEIDNNYLQQLYPDSIKLLGTEVKRVFDFEPTIINGPKTVSKWDDIYYDNENRRLYFIRPKVNPDTGSFPASDVENQESKWK